MKDRKKILKRLERQNEKKDECLLINVLNHVSSSMKRGKYNVSLHNIYLVFLKEGKTLI